ncbi:MAG: tyrosine--tRNA ligase, partial [Candidatus Peribacteraceae bacterium]
LQKAFGKREKFVLTVKLLEGTDGRKMSKTYGNCIYIEDEPNDMYGKVLSVNDDLMAQYFECCTDVPMEEVQKMLKGKPRDAKARLAREIVAIYHGEAAALAAEQEFISVFKEGGLPEDMPEVKVKEGTLLIDVLVKEKLIASKSEARRLVEQGGIRVNDKPVTSIDAKVEEGMTAGASAKEVIVRVGKRKFLKILYTK